ncbi:hypothetical protein [Pandoraea terrigena]|nr:hypothetical protein [Pandoraea terrigena]
MSAALLRTGTMTILRRSRTPVRPALAWLPCWLMAPYLRGDVSNS